MSRSTKMFNTALGGGEGRAARDPEQISRPATHPPPLLIILRYELLFSSSQMDESRLHTTHQNCAENAIGRLASTPRTKASSSGPALRQRGCARGVPCVRCVLKKNPPSHQLIDLPPSTSSQLKRGRTIASAGRVNLRYTRKLPPIFCHIPKN